jgi:hypothetical protein
MAKTYYAQGGDGGIVVPEPTTPTASGQPMILVDMGPTLGKQWRYSGDVNGTTTYYFVNNGPTLGTQRSTT